jgi:hypothetical protein
MSTKFDLTNDVCYRQKVKADNLFSEFKYEAALEMYVQALDCFEKYMDYTQPPKTPKTSKMINGFINQIKNKIQVMNRLIKSKSKRKLREDYKLEDLKKYTEKDWEELPLFDTIMISDIYNVPISQNESNMEHMKYRFYQDFTTKYNPELKNLQQIELIATIMIMEGKYDEVLSLLNVSPRLNQLIEDEVLKKNKVSKILSSRVQKFTNHLSDDVIFAIDHCSLIIRLTMKQKQEIRETLFQLFVKELEKLEYIPYKDSFYRVPILEVDEIKKIIKSLNVYLRKLIEGTTKVLNLIDFKNDDECIYIILSGHNAFFKRTLNNIDRMFNQNQNYISIRNF